MPSMNTCVFSESLRSLFAVVSCGMSLIPELFHMLFHMVKQIAPISFFKQHTSDEFTVSSMGKLICVFVRCFIQDFCGSSPST